MRKRKQIMHYSNRDVILLVGEGDFSFAKCLANSFGSATNMVATSFDSEEELYLKASTSNAKCGKTQGFRMHCDTWSRCKTMSMHPYLYRKRFDKIVYNFPHARFFGRKVHYFQIVLHRDLVKGFFRRAKSMLMPRGEVHVTHKTKFPFNVWAIEQLAEDEGLILVEEVEKSVFLGGRMQHF